MHVNNPAASIKPFMRAALHFADTYLHKAESCQSSNLPVSNSPARFVQSYTSQIRSPWPSFPAVTHPPELYAATRNTNGSLIIESKLTHLMGRERGSVDEGENENSREKKQRGDKTRLSSD